MNLGLPHLSFKMCEKGSSHVRAPWIRRDWIRHIPKWITEAFFKDIWLNGSPKTYNYSSYKVMWRISELIVIAYEKKFYFSKLILQHFCYWKWNMLLTVVVYLIIDIYYYFVIPMRDWTYSLIYYLFVYVISLHFLNHSFLMSSEIGKEYREHRMLHHTSHESLEHCVSCKLLNEFFKPIHYIL